MGWRPDASISSNKWHMHVKRSARYSQICGFSGAKSTSRISYFGSPPTSGASITTLTTSSHSTPIYLLFSTNGSTIIMKSRSHYPSVAKFFLNTRALTQERQFHTGRMFRNGRSWFAPLHPEKAVGSKSKRLMGVVFDVDGTLWLENFSFVQF
jgi:hypothetical protein